jgi:hypothetical protein
MGLALLLLTGAVFYFRAASAPNGARSHAPAAMPTADSLARRIADRYGARAFPKLDSLHYVFNVHFKDKEIARAWTWFPKSDSVIYNGPDAKGLPISAAYSRKNPASMGSEPVASLDKSFINDQYWLLFPLHLSWDKGLSFSIAAGEKPGEAYRLTATYPAAGGYTPGDAYDLFVDSSATIKRWIFRRGNSPQATQEAFWSAPADFLGVEISLEHPGAGPGFKLWFSQVRVGA